MPIPESQAEFAFPGEAGAGRRQAAPACCAHRSTGFHSRSPVPIAVGSDVPLHKIPYV